jgi:hypothetical protein
MRLAAVLALCVTGCILRGGGVATYRPGHGAGVEGTATVAFGGKGQTGPGAAMGVTLSGGYDGLGAVAGGGAASFEYFSPYLSSANNAILTGMLACGGRFIDKRVNGSIIGAVSCELRAGMLRLLDDGGGQYARWGGLDLVVRYAFAGDELANGWTLGLAGTWEHWMTYGRVR